MSAGIDSLLDISRRALGTQSQTVRVIGNNIANVNTEGYSRRRTEIVATRSVSLAGGAYGTGANIHKVERMSDSFLLEEQYLRIQDRSYANVRKEFLSRAEGMFSVDSEKGRIGHELSEFFSTLEDLQADPSSIPLRSALIQQGESLTTSIKNTYTLLSDLQRESDRRLDVLVKDVNRLTGEIAELNSQIAESERGLQDNLTLRDEREERLRELSELISIQTVENSDGEILVTLTNGFGLVTGVRNNELEFVKDPSFEPATGYPHGLDGGELGFIVYDFDKTDGGKSHVNLTDVIAKGKGEISGVLSVRGIQKETDTSPFDASGDLVKIASHVEIISRDLLTRFNKAYLGEDEDLNPLNGHQASSGDLNSNSPGVYGLFNAESPISDTVTADGLPNDLLSNISYASQIIFNVSDPAKLAFSKDLDPTPSSSSYASGDGSILSDLLKEREKIVDYSVATYGISHVEFTGTLEELYDASVTVVGGISAKANNQLIIAEDRETQINEAVSSLSGVSLDEELAQLINFQKAFQASARMVSVGDEMLTEILNLLL